MVDKLKINQKSYNYNRSIYFSNLRLTFLGRLTSTFVHSIRASLTCYDCNSVYIPFTSGPPCCHYGSTNVLTLDHLNKILIHFTADRDQAAKNEIGQLI